MSDYDERIVRNRKRIGTDSIFGTPVYESERETLARMERESRLASAPGESLFTSPLTDEVSMITGAQMSELGGEAAAKGTKHGNTSSASVPSLNAGGIKHDQSKEPLSLLSRTWLLGVSRVMGFGAKKYAAHNWRGGIERSRLLSAALRHLLAYNEGQDLDPETGLNHLDHASCCLMFARELHDTRPDLDDRFKLNKGTKE